MWQMRPGIITCRAALDGGVAGSWQTTFSTTLNSNSAGWNGFTMRQVIAAANLSTSGSKVRITYNASSVTEGFQVDACYIGHAAGAGDAYDFDGGQVQVTFNSGSAGFSIGIGATIVSDEITFSLDETKNLIVAAHANNSAADITRSGLVAGNTHYFKSANEAGTTNVTGYSSSGANTVVGISKIEVFA